jgi:YidC/Oxa1 family membrane protein insertase
MWEWFIDLLFQILSAIAGVVGDWGLAIILFTFIIRLLLTPLTIKSTKSSAKMQAMQPMMKEIQEKYADDPQRQQQELQKFYAENSFNPLGGCLPLLLQMPIFFALFSVLRDKLPETAHFFNILPSLSQSLSGAFALGGIQEAWVYIVLDILFGVLTLVPMVINARNSDPSQRNQTLIMGVIMAGMMCWFGLNVPVGVLLYYDTSAAWGALQQTFVTRRVLEAAKAEHEARMKNRPIEVDVVRKEHKPRQHKKS